MVWIWLIFWIGQLMRALEDSGHLHDMDVIIVSDHGQMDLSRVISKAMMKSEIIRMIWIGRMQ